MKGDIVQTNIEEFLRPHTQTDRILAVLKKAGPAGVTNRELNKIAFRYGARIHDLRRDGHKIKAIQIKRGYWRFILV